MQYEKTEKAPLTSTQYEKRIETVPSSSTVITRSITIDDYRQNSEIRRKRIILLILLAIQLVKKEFIIKKKVLYIILLGFRFILFS